MIKFSAKHPDSMIKVLCGVMTGGTWGPNVRAWGATDGEVGKEQNDT